MIGTGNGSGTDLRTGTGTDVGSAENEETTGIGGRIGEIPGQEETAEVLAGAMHPMLVVDDAETDDGRRPSRLLRSRSCMAYMRYITLFLFCKYAMDTVKSKYK